MLARQDSLEHLGRAVPSLLLFIILRLLRKTQNKAPSFQEPDTYPLLEEKAA
jgi:hypothetical protein